MKKKYILLYILVAVAFIWIDVDMSFSISWTAVLGLALLAAIAVALYFLIYAAFIKSRQFLIHGLAISGVVVVSILIAGKINAYKAEATKKKAELLIARIESYKAENGQYPDKLEDLPDFKIGDGESEMGITWKRYIFYNPSRQGFNIRFAYPVWMLYTFDSKTRTWVLDD